MYLWAADTHFDTAVVSPREQGEAWAAHFPESRGILLTGDMGTSRCLKQVLTDLRDGLNRPVYFVLGNHDYWYSSFRRVDEEVRAWNIDGVHHLADGGLTLGDVTILGNGGWYDGRYEEMPDFGMSDFDKVEELTQDPEIRSRARADLLARTLIPSGEYKKLIVVTHVPPFKNLADEADFSGCYGSSASEVAIREAAQSADEVIVLCGHTHFAQIYSTENITAYSGEAKRGRPVLAGLLHEEEFRVEPV